MLGDKEKYTFPSVTDYFDPNGRLAIDGKINDLICEKSEVTGLLRSHPVVQAMTLEPFPIYPVDPAERLSIERRDSQFSIIVNTYKRHEALKTFLRTYEGCPNLHTIHVIWNESLEVPGEFVQPYQKKSGKRHFVTKRSSHRG